MATVTQAHPVNPPAHGLSPVNLSAQHAQTPPGLDPGHVINAHEATLADYLYQPVQDILSRLGLPPIPAPVPPRGAPDTDMLPRAVNPVEPTQMIKPRVPLRSDTTQKVDDACQNRF